MMRSKKDDYNRFLEEYNRFNTALKENTDLYNHAQLVCDGDDDDGGGCDDVGGGGSRSIFGSVWCCVMM